MLCAEASTGSAIKVPNEEECLLAIARCAESTASTLDTRRSVTAALRKTKTTRVRATASAAQAARSAEIAAEPSRLANAATSATAGLVQRLPVMGSVANAGSLSPLQPSTVGAAHPSEFVENPIGGPSGLGWLEVWEVSFKAPLAHRVTGCWEEPVFYGKRRTGVGKPGCSLVTDLCC